MSRKKSAQLGRFFGIGDRIKQIRGNLTQIEFAKIFGVRDSTVSRWEYGRLSDEETLKKIADFGGVTVEWLLRGDPLYIELGLAGHSGGGIPPKEALLRADQVAQSLGVSAQHVRRLWRERKLLGVKLSPRRLMFRPKDVQKYLITINKWSKPET